MEQLYLRYLQVKCHEASKRSRAVPFNFHEVPVPFRICFLSSLSSKDPLQIAIDISHRVKSRPLLHRSFNIINFYLQQKKKSNSIGNKFPAGIRRASFFIIQYIPVILGIASLWFSKSGMLPSSSSFFFQKQLNFSEPF